MRSVGGHDPKGTPGAKRLKKKNPSTRPANLVQLSFPLKHADVVDLLKRYLPAGDLDPAVRNLEIYQRAMIHRSFSAGSATSIPTKESYERLEFLGDAVLNLATAAYLFERYPNGDEGFMTRMRTHLINGKMLADLCSRHTNLSTFIAVGNRGERRDPLPFNVLEDVFEAFLGAIFLDSGFDVAKKWLVGLWESSVDFSELAAKQDGHKATLNRYCMRNLGFVPFVEALGEDGRCIGVRVRTPDGTVIGTGMSPESMSGESANHRRKVAEEIAIKKALEYYGESVGRPDAK